MRLSHTRAGPRYVVQVPEPRCPVSGWRAYAVLALGPDGDAPLHLTLYERMEEPEAPYGPRAA